MCVSELEFSLSISISISVSIYIDGEGLLDHMVTIFLVF